MGRAGLEASHWEARPAAPQNRMRPWIWIQRLVAEDCEVMRPKSVEVGLVEGPDIWARLKVLMASLRPVTN